MSRLFEIFRRSPRYSIRVDSYFPIYEEAFAPFVGRPVTFVEVGVLHGGALFMWREYFGPHARIIGIDVDEGARQLESHGFEIFIGNQADPAFWASFFAKIGQIDILLDDGGHSNVEQAVTLHAAVGHVKDGGIVMIEDVHTSYMQRFANPSRYSFVNLAKHAVDVINSRFPKLRRIESPLRNCVYSVAFFESVVVFRIDRRLCAESRVIENAGESLGAPFDKQPDDPALKRALKRLLAGLKLLSTARRLRNSVARLRTRRQIGKYFR